MRQSAIIPQKINQCFTDDHINTCKLKTEEERLYLSRNPIQYIYEALHKFI